MTVAVSLLLSPRFTPDSRSMREAARALGWDTFRAPSWRLPPDFDPQGELVVYGEPLFAAVVAQQTSLVLLEPTFDWLARLPSHALRREVSAATLQEARAIRRPRFIKPADDKCFPAKVWESGCDLPGEEALPGTTPVLVSEPVEWEVEFRAFVAERTIGAISPYVRAGELVVNDAGVWLDPATADAREFIEGLVGDDTIPIPIAAALDVGWIRGRGWAVVEANPAWGAGIYGCEPARALAVVRRACRRPAGVKDSDREWIVRRT